ncbi:MAG: cation transporter [Ignavibacteria bacterium]|nr:cation transporter [Ignavibacteria bacterium]
MEKNIIIRCTEMSCGACKSSITKSINQLSGITGLYIDLDSKIIEVSYENTVTGQKAVLNAVLDAGFEAELISDSTAEIAA